MTGRALRGRGVTVVPAATTKGRDLLFTAGAEVPAAADWSAYAPRLIDRGDGTPVVDTAFTRLTGKSPILLAGMTPTTVDPEIVAAAANAGHWAELAGGGQVTEQIFAENVATLDRAARRGPHGPVQHPVPRPLPVEDAGRRSAPRPEGPARRRPVRRPGDQRRHPRDSRTPSRSSRTCTRPASATSCSSPARSSRSARSLAIAREVETPVIAHIEGGVAGGHHSWEDLDELLLATYAELRSRRQPGRLRRWRHRYAGPRGRLPHRHLGSRPR